MGSDQPPQAIFDAVFQMHQDLGSSVHFVVIATDPYYTQLQKSYDLPIEWVLAEEYIEMDELPLAAVRKKKNSSMAVGIRLLGEGKIDAFVSTGNTGALVATSVVHLPPLSGIERPALLVMLPTGQHKVAVLDVGAHIAPKPSQLLEFARLGSAYVRSSDLSLSPRIGLLNIGEEEQKGTPIFQESYQLLQDYFKESFLGNIEGREVFQGKIDVLVTDGFTGNVFLKTSEGVLSFLVSYLYKQFSTKKEVVEVISHLYKEFNYSEQPGAILCGVEGIVVKCHGHSDTTALMNGIRGAIDLAQREIIKKMKTYL